MKVTQHTVLRDFGGVFADEATVASAPLLSQIVDQVRRPELVTEDLYFALDVELSPGGSEVAGPTYEFWPGHSGVWDETPVFLLVESDVLVKLTGETLAGQSTWILQGTNTDTAGVHKAIFQFQGCIEDITIHTPSTTQGGEAGKVRVRVFQMPELSPTYVQGLT